MTLKTQFQTDFDATGLNTNEFAETVTYVQGSTETSIEAIIDWPETPPDPMADGIQLTFDVTIQFSKTDIAAPTHTDKVKVTPPWASSEQTWKLVGMPAYSYGMWTARMAYTVPIEKSARDYRRPLT